MVKLEKIQEWVRIYLQHIQEVTLEYHVKEEEGYKFTAVENFQKNFNLEASDLRGMLEKAIINNNLVTGAQFWPRKMLLQYAEEFPEETRRALGELFDESKDVYTRLTNTSRLLEEINEKRNEKHGESVHSYMGLRFLSLLLGYRYPNTCNALKPSEWKFFARYLDPEFSIPKHTPVGEQYRMYEKHIDDLRTSIEGREDIKAIRNALTRGLEFQDEGFRWITQDVIYVTARLLAGKRSNEEAALPSESTIDEDTENLINEAVEENTGFVPLEKHLEEYVMKNWDLIDFGEKLSIYREEDGTPGQQYTTDVGIIDILAKDAAGNFVVIEIKRDTTRYHVVGQILNYMTWVQENLVANGEKVRGLIVVGKADNTLISAVKQVADKVSLKEYRIKMTFTKPE